MSRRITGRYGLESGSGMKNTPEELAELEERRAEHAKAIKGKPRVSFGDLLEQKMGGDQPEEPEEEAEEEQGAKDPLLGLSPSQSPELAEGKKGRRSGKVIIKG